MSSTHGLIRAGIVLVILGLFLSPLTACGSSNIDAMVTTASSATGNSMPSSTQPETTALTTSTTLPPTTIAPTTTTDRPTTTTEKLTTTTTEKPTTTTEKQTTTTIKQSDGVTVYITETGAKYHRGTCRYLSQSKIAISLSDAKAQGYAACKVCKPPQ